MFKSNQIPDYQYLLNLSGDRLIRPRSRPQAGARPQSQQVLTKPPPVAPPRNRRPNKATVGQILSLDSQPAASPIPSRASTKTNDSKNFVSSSVQEAPLIHFESSESEADLFDPLGKPKLSSSGNMDSKSDNLDFMLMDEGIDEDVQLRGLERNRGSRSSLTRSKAFRRESQKGRIRLVNEVRDEGSDDEDNISSEKHDIVIFDPLDSSGTTGAKHPSLSSLGPKMRSNSMSQERSRTSSDLMKYEWSLTSLAPSPHVYLPPGVIRGIGLGARHNSFSQSVDEGQPIGLVRQSTLPAPANPFYNASPSSPLSRPQQQKQQPSPQRSQTSIASTGMTGEFKPPVLGSIANTLPRSSSPFAQPVGLAQPSSLVGTGLNPSPAHRYPSPTHSSHQKQTQQMHRPMSNISSLSSNTTFSPKSVPTFVRQPYTTGSSQSITSGMASPFTRVQSNTNIVGPRPGYSGTNNRSSSTSPSHGLGSSSTMSGQSASDPFGDLVKLGFGKTGNNNQQQHPQQQPKQQQKDNKPGSGSGQAPPKPQLSKWETFEC